MARRIVAGLIVAGLPLLSVDRPGAFQGTACPDLAALTIPDVTVNGAAMVAPGPFTPPGSPAGHLSGPLRVVAALRKPPNKTLGGSPDSLRAGAIPQTLGRRTTLAEKP